MIERRARRTPQWMTNWTTEMRERLMREYERAGIPGAIAAFPQIPESKLRAQIKLQRRLARAATVQPPAMQAVKNAVPGQKRKRWTPEFELRFLQAITNKTWTL